MGRKRKRNNRFSHIPRERESPSQQTVFEDSKRRRLSNDLDASEDDAPTQTREYVKLGQGEDDGWTKVTSKQSKAGRSKGDRNSDDYPRLRYHQTYQSELRIRDLKDLGMYVLADEVAPKWIAVANAKSTKKVVVLMVPGLDKPLLERARMLMNAQEATSGSNGHASNTISGEKVNDDTNGGSNHINPTPSTELQFKSKEAGRLVACAIRSDGLPQAQAWLFENVLNVTAPGDAKIQRVHSPLQAMLLGPDPEQKKNPTGFHDHTPKLAPTPITDFIHTADELREAEFPIHPATFTTQVDAGYEATRREQTGQSTKDGWIDTHVTVSHPQVDLNSRDPISQGVSLYSLDCEMVQTSDDVYSLARISMISYPEGKVVIDKYVKPSLPIKNYFTQFSGITPEILENVTTTLQDIQKELFEILGPSSVLLGHSLDSDLNALKLTHPFVVDTSMIYPHPRGLPLRSSLKYLTNKYLKREIQMAGADGHNSVEDAQAVLDLVKLKCEKGPKWGTMEANGEPVFRRLKRFGRTSAMVDYGTPERGFGKDATYTIGCHNDDEVAKGVIRAARGDNFFDFEIPAGGAEYIWGRFRALEYARGWVTGSAPTFPSPTQDQNDDNQQSNNANEEKDKLDKLALQTLDYIQQVYDTLPAKSLLIVFSGTADMRPVMRLQAQQQAYRKEFKVKKWDELTVKWTDTEDQALRQACADARAGWGVCVIK
ncbi:hypothetical protein H2198_002317 [Neophaeococcomyces mojaviensis]|uniref:Uncharacterized protein n=1 Tax=Neophaeococcomyces mojaviensis TaxID=3383035 RepID=A0ACC3AEM5_9EURO|nr:hypothetical protein H2198_002317 [Knufia sp. JES_112]